MLISFSETAGFNVNPDQIPQNYGIYPSMRSHGECLHGWSREFCSTATGCDDDTPGTSAQSWFRWRTRSLATTPTTTKLAVSMGSRMGP